MSKDTQPSKSKFELTVDLIKAIIWPIVVSFLLIVFWRPIYSTINQIPKVVNNSETITIGSLSLKIRSNSNLIPSDSVKISLEALSASGINSLLTSNGTSEYFYENQVLFGEQKYEELIRLCLYEKMDSIHYGRDFKGVPFYYGVIPTHKGIDVRNYLISLLTGLVKEIN